jgi:hypothetical protein
MNKNIKFYITIALLVLVFIGGGYTIIHYYNFIEPKEVSTAVVGTGFVKTPIKDLEAPFLEKTFVLTDTSTSQEVYDFYRVFFAQLNKEKNPSEEALPLLLDRLEIQNKNSTVYATFLHQVLNMMRVYGYNESLEGSFKRDPVLAEIWGKTLVELHIKDPKDSVYFSVILQKNIGEYILNNTKLESLFVVSRVVAGIHTMNYIKNLSTTDPAKVKANNIESSEKILSLINSSIKWNWGLEDTPTYLINTQYYIGWYGYLADMTLKQDVSKDIFILEKAIRNQGNDSITGVPRHKAYARLYMAVIPFETTKEYEGMKVADAQKLKLSAIKTVLDPVFLSSDFSTNIEYSLFKNYIKKAYSGEKGPSYDHIKPMLDFLVANDVQYKKIIESL